MNRSFLALASLALAVASVSAANYKVKGQVRCPVTPEKQRGVEVKLIEEDSGLDPDDTMDTGVTDAEGRFTLDGDESELTGIEPFLKIYHKCNHNLICNRKWKFELPTSYIDSGKVFDIGVIDMEMWISGEEKDCI